jgi:lactoylglutathione lyase
VNPDDFPAPREGFVLSFFLVVADQDRSRAFYQRVFNGTVLSERDPVILKVANAWLIMNEPGGPTDDKPTVTLTTPPNPDRTSAFLNIRVADIATAYAEWSAGGAEFLTEPKDHGREIRAYIRDPDGHLIEVGQFVGIPAEERSPAVIGRADSGSGGRTRTCNQAVNSHRYGRPPA